VAGRSVSIQRGDTLVMVHASLKLKVIQGSSNHRHDVNQIKTRKIAHAKVCDFRFMVIVTMAALLIRTVRLRDIITIVAHYIRIVGPSGRTPK